MTIYKHSRISTHVLASQGKTGRMVFYVFILLSLFFLNPGVSFTPKLEQRITDDDIHYRIDYVDSKGRVRFNTEEQYATYQETLEDDYTLLVEYFDEKGNPAEQPEGYFAVRRIYNDDDKIVWTIYLDEYGEPRECIYGYAMVYRTFQDKILDEIRYFDRNGEPVATDKGVYGVHFVHDDEGRFIEFIYLGIDGNPVPHKNGYTSYRREYNSEEQVFRDTYFDGDGNPVTSTIGEYGVQYEYDEYGRRTLVTYIDSEGKPINTSRNYAFIKTTYLDNGYIFQYYDKDGDPVMAGRKCYGELHIGDMTYYLDRNGARMYRLDNLLAVHPYVVILLGTAAAAIAARLSGRIRPAFLVLYMLFILFMTLMVRESGEPVVKLELFYSYRSFFTSPGRRREIIYNIWLFVPFGAMLRNMSGDKNRTPGRRKGNKENGSEIRSCSRFPGWLWFVLFSAVIELSQYISRVGWCELDDIFNNSLGGAIGYLYAAGVMASGVLAHIKKNEEGIQE